MHLSDILNKIIKKEELPKDFTYEKEDYLFYEELEDFPNYKLLCLTYNFIDFYKSNDFSFLKNYIQEVEHYKAIEEEIIKLKKEILKEGNIKREVKIYFYKIKEKFTKKEEDYKSRSYLMNMILYFYIEAIEYLRFEKKDDEVEEKRKPVSVISIDAQGNKKNLFVDRNQPTMSLNEFADKVMAQNKVVESVKEEKKEDSLQELRKKDEFNDDLKIYKRNLG